VNFVSIDAWKKRVYFRTYAAGIKTRVLGVRSLVRENERITETSQYLLKVQVIKKGSL